MGTTNARIGRARCFIDKHDVAAQRAAVLELGVEADRIDTDRGLTGTNRGGPG